MVTSKIYPGLLSAAEIQQIRDFYDQQPAFYAESGILNKNLEYHIPENFIYKLMNPKLNLVLGEHHEFDTGSYKSSSRPYIIHVDSRQQHDQYPDCMSFGSKTVKQNKAILVPLVEGNGLRTVTFKVWSDLNPTQDQFLIHAGPKNHLLAEDFDHDSNFNYIQNLPVDMDYHWNVGDILVWDRNQWHMSTNFSKYNTIKTFLVFFMS